VYLDAKRRYINTLPFLPFLYSTTLSEFVKAELSFPSIIRLRRVILRYRVTRNRFVTTSQKDVRYFTRYCASPLRRGEMFNDARRIHECRDYSAELGPTNLVAPHSEKHDITTRQKLTASPAYASSRSSS